ncbi:hypothetical protein [Stenotrophomonas nematodicola]|uniref:hypothetical protein n=1 Tax=Stenotrophomonas nematodicola TaxID=2656746 RepID=UPI00129119DF|nr:hypothetical protein [Stenotrophomonas nematodicola]
MTYYKTNDPAVLTAWEQERAGKAELQAEIDAFAARFGGEGLMYADTARLAGIRFSPAKPRDLWRSPDHNGLQWPRSAPLKGATAETKAALKALQAEWNDHLPAREIDTNAVYRALGFSSSLDFLFEGLRLFRANGFVYASTKKAMPRMTEILGSEYELAKAARA